VNLIIALPSNWFGGQSSSSYPLLEIFVAVTSSSTLNITVIASEIDEDRESM
jgi:hypothetical protein